MADTGVTRRDLRHAFISDLPLAGWGTPHAVTFSGTAARNSTAIATETRFCSIRVIGGAAHFRQGDDQVAATANFGTSVYISDEDGWVEVTTINAKHISFIQAAGSSAVQAQIVERI